jgi:hypothetical protein
MKFDVCRRQVHALRDCAADWSCAVWAKRAWIGLKQFFIGGNPGPRIVLNPQLSRQTSSRQNYP